MTKTVQLIILCSFIVIGGGGLSYVVYTRSSNNGETRVCPFEVKTCPDGTGVARTGKNCDFAMCPNVPLPQVPSNPTSNIAPATTTGTNTQETKTSGQPSVSPKVANQVPPTEKPKASVISNIVSTITGMFGKNTPPPVVEVVQVATNVVTKTNNSQAFPPADFAGQQYVIKDGSIVTTDNKVVYVIPESVTQQASGGNSDWNNHSVNVIPVGTVPPVIGGIPVDGLPGKYYLSENSYGNIDNCEFSNKIFILDTNTNTLTLMYEENSNTLSRDDPRACTSEIFLLATESNKLIIKYHTLGTNTVCDSEWSEPEKTWYLNVTNLQEAMSKYTIPKSRYDSAEAEEQACRSKL